MCETKVVQIPAECGPLDLDRPHFVGIGGAGMSALARVLAEQGARVTGSDVRASEVTEQLSSLGCRIHIGQRAENLDQPSVVVWSSAIAEDNAELAAARAAGIPLAHRSHVLAHLMNAAGRTSVVVAGTHGKSTTTAMLATALGERDASFAGGAALLAGANAHHGSGSVFVAEGDESDRSLTHYRPHVAVLLNLEDDHPETFAGVEEIHALARDFTAGAQVLVVCADDPGARALTADVRGQHALDIVTFGEAADADVRITSLQSTGWGSRVTVEDRDGRPVTMRLRVPGRHNALNAVAAFTTGRVLKVPAAELAEQLGQFAGIEGRMSLVGTTHEGATVLGSYAHHPTALAADLAAARTLTSGRVIAVCEPRGAQRTALMGTAMGRALAAADEVVLLPVHSTMPATADRPGLAEIAAAVTGAGGRVHQALDAGQAADLVATAAGPGDLVLAVTTNQTVHLGASILTPGAAAACA